MPNTRAGSLRYVVVSLFFLAIPVPTTAMADIITLKLPGITGDVTVVGQEDTIEVLSLTYRELKAKPCQFLAIL
jgi:hypothetical protein